MVGVLEWKVGATGANIWKEKRKGLVQMGKNSHAGSMNNDANLIIYAPLQLKVRAQKG